MTMMASKKESLEFLHQNVYSKFSAGRLRPYPNPLLPQHIGKEVTQYHFETKTSLVFTCLHQLWYNWDSDLSKFVKRIPHCIEEMFSTQSLAHWIMEDGYFDNYGRTKTLILCTESFTKEECIILQNILLKYDIKSSLKTRNSIKDTYRIRISKISMPNLQHLVRPYMHTSFLYKLGNVEE